MSVLALLPNLDLFCAVRFWARVVNCNCPVIPHCLQALFLIAARVLYVTYFHHALCCHVCLCFMMKKKLDVAYKL